MCTSLLHSSYIRRGSRCVVPRKKGGKVGLPTIDGNISNSQKARLPRLRRGGHRRRLRPVPVIPAWLIEGPSELVFCPFLSPAAAGRGRN